MSCVYNYPFNEVISVLIVNYHPSDEVLSVLSVNYYPSNGVISIELKNIPSRGLRSNVQRRGPNMLLQTSMSCKKAKVFKFTLEFMNFYQLLYKFWSWVINDINVLIYPYIKGLMCTLQNKYVWECSTKYLRGYIIERVRGIQYIICC